MTSLHRRAFSAEISVVEVKKEKAQGGSFPIYQQKKNPDCFPSVNIVCGSFCLQAGSTVCGEPPPLGVGDRKLWRQRHHSGAPEQRSGCGVVGQAQVSRCSDDDDCKRQGAIVLLLLYNDTMLAARLKDGRKKRPNLASVVPESSLCWSFQSSLNITRWP